MVSHSRRTNTPALSFDEHERFVRNLARSLIVDEARADDVVQETWLAVLEHPPRDVASPRAWLARVVRNAAYKTSRAERRRARREQAAARAEAVPSADDLAEREALRRRLIAAAESLEEPMRVTLLLRFVEDLPPREVARRLGVPVETVRSRVRLARERLRRELDREYGDRHAWTLVLLPLAGGPPSSAASGAGALARPRERWLTRASDWAATTPAGQALALVCLVLVACVVFRLAQRDRTPRAPCRSGWSSDADSSTPSR